MKKVSFTFIILLIALTAIGCGGKEVPKPVPVVDGVDRCAVCNMLVPDDHNATEIILKDGKALKFDDIGCHFGWLKQNGTDQVAVQYVRDYETEEWIKLEDATFVYEADLQTPMAYGIYSFKDKAKAEKFVGDLGAGTILTAKELENHHWERNKEMMGGHAHGHGMNNGDAMMGNDQHENEHEDGNDDGNGK